MGNNKPVFDPSCGGLCNWISAFILSGLETILVISGIKMASQIDLSPQNHKQW